MDGTNGSILKADPVGERVNFTQEDKIIDIITFEGNVAVGASLGSKCEVFLRLRSVLYV